MATPTFMRVVEYQALAYKRTWKGSVVTSFLNPVLFLAAMGLGLGSLVEEGVGGVSYLDFVATGLLAATAMQTAAGESSYPVMAGWKWFRTYYAMLATPLGVNDVIAGHLIWVAVRLTMSAVVFLAVMAAFGAVESVAAVLAVPAAVLCGMAFAAPITAYSARLELDEGFAFLFRFFIIPLFLFSGTFFPIAQLPAPLQFVAYATPSWHGVELCRNLALGLGSPLTDLGHAAYLFSWMIGGWVWAVRALERRMVT